ncbi:S9 family peptidase [Phreatobacter sp. AB_2022a]|uniref:S9 family peptidase n=1 Tax=Phreatobacter sp. AB_2022a TaxID=3003134 RepID=UPI002286F2C8|nr:S9 family peptidase [Phreatobacter sp. AB_2022a]MCZ0737037.1 S9 family peptidase [Phreatobacter sp. AB_2022a]
MTDKRARLDAAAAAAPVAARQPVEKIMHDVVLRDDYDWLRAANWQAAIRDPSLLPAPIRTYLEAENAYARAVLKPVEPLIDALFQEMKGRIKQDDSSVPAPDGAWEYYESFRLGGQHPMICRRPRGTTAGEQVMLDGDALADGKPYFDLGAAAHSPDHARLAWSHDDKGSEFFTIAVRDLATGQDLGDLVTETGGDAVWSADSTAFHYIRLDDNHRPLKVFRHAIGTDAAADRLVYEETDTTVFVGLDRATSGDVAFITGAQSDSTEVRLLDLRDPAAAPRLILPREDEVKSHPDHHPSYEGRPTLFILTNADGAEDYKVVVTPATDPARSAWRELVPHRPGVLILSITVLRRWLVRLERENALPRIVVRHLETGEEHAIAFDEEAYSLGIVGGYEFDTDTLRFAYSSMTTPSEIWDYDMARRERVLRKRQEVPSGHDPSAYVTRRLLAPAADGETVPVSLVYRKDLALDGTAPLLLYGYGSYGASMPASFSTTRLSLVDRGFVYAIAHVRGGMEKGYRWYRNGKREHKLNTFTDFIAAAEHLAAERFTAPGRIVTHGGSAGGLLMGAIANMRPELWGGVIAEVPFVDLVNTMLDDTLPLTPPEWREWGDPIRDADAFRRMLGYSPYDNVAAHAYPPILALAGVSDPRVTYWEPAKWVARLRAAKTDANPVLLVTNMDSGHGGAAGRFDRLKEVAKAYAFAIAVVGARDAVA